VSKRVRMLRAADAEVVVLGFSRQGSEARRIVDCETIDLGRTHNARFAQRAMSVVGQILSVGRHADALRGADVYLARNLEMLAIAAAARRRFGRGVGLVYECLDIHRLMLRADLIGAGMRWLERTLAAKAGLLVVSSPAFLKAYFEPRQGLGRDWSIPVLLQENKVFEAGSSRSHSAPLAPPPAPPWRIAWYGAIRCAKSLDFLHALAERRPDLVEIEIRGIPSLNEFENFEGSTCDLPNLTFGGPYGPDDLARLYGAAHFAWAIDYFEEGANSTWLLPNRVYESNLFGATPIALADVETGAWLKGHGLGVVLNNLADIEGFLAGLTPDAYATLVAANRRAPRTTFVSDLAECVRLAEALKGAAPCPA